MPSQGKFTRQGEMSAMRIFRTRTVLTACAASLMMMGVTLFGLGVGSVGATKPTKPTKPRLTMRPMSSTRPMNSTKRTISKRKALRPLRLTTRRRNMMPPTNSRRR